MKIISFAKPRQVAPEILLENLRIENFILTMATLILKIRISQF